MKYSRSHDVMQQVFMTGVICILFAFSLYLFFAGHNNPGGGFIAGLMTASAFALVYMIFGQATARQIMRFSYPVLIAVGILLAALTGSIGPLVGDPFFTHYFDYFTIPLIGEVELTTAVPFDFGVYLVVIGTTLAATLTIAEDGD